MKKIYLDVYRVRLESEAILLIQKYFEIGEWQWIRSIVVDYEINKTPMIERRLRLRRLANRAHEVIPLTPTVINRSAELKKLGFKTHDALHVACAEAGQVEVLLTTDDKLVKMGTRYAHQLKVRIENPLKWLQEEINDEHTNHDFGTNTFRRP